MGSYGRGRVRFHDALNRTIAHKQAFLGSPDSGHAPQRYLALTGGPTERFLGRANSDHQEPLVGATTRRPTADSSSSESRHPINGIGRQCSSAKRRNPAVCHRGRQIPGVRPRTPGAPRFHNRRRMTAASAVSVLIRVPDSQAVSFCLFNKLAQPFTEGSGQLIGDLDPHVYLSQLY